jgi:tagatose 1,6-diphosphate aldolase GatY/KbaY
MRNTKKVVGWARQARRGILVEAEIDHITGSSVPQLETSVASIQKQGQYTDPETAAYFVRMTGVDILAAFVGNVHGAYKEPKTLDLDRLHQISQKTHCFLSLHGGSTIPAGAIKTAIKVGGIVKVNVNTELRMAFRNTLEKTLKTSDEVAVYKLMPPVIEAVQKVVEQKMKLFGSVGQALR